MVSEDVLVLSMNNPWFPVSQELTVTAESDEPWESLALRGKANFLGRGGRGTA